VKRARVWVHCVVWVAAGLASAGCGRETFRGAPVILISVDTLRSDRLPAYGFAAGTTPALDRLRADSILFERAYSHYPLTLPSHTSMLTGLLPGAHGVRDNAGYKLSAEPATLAEIFRQAGYATGGSVSTFLLRSETGIARGFDFWEENFESEPGTSPDGVERRGGVTVDLALAWVRSQARAGKPFLLFLHLYEPHFPYQPAAPFDRQYSDSPYDGEIATVDAILGRFFDELRRLDVYDRAIVAFTSDHGEGLGEHGEAQHGVFLYRETLQVPLFLKLPGGNRAGSTAQLPAATADIAPTLAQLSGLKSAPRMEGSFLLDLFAENDENDPERPIYSETFYPRIHFGWEHLTSLIQGSLHYQHGPRPELFDLVADPAERTDLAGQERRRAAEFRQALAAYDVPLAAPAAADRETTERLAALGYLAGPSTAVTGALTDPREHRPALAMMQRSAVAFAERRFDESAEILTELLAQQPNMIQPSNMLALSLERAGRAADAAEAYRRALRLAGGNSPDLALKIAQMLLDAGDRAGAVTHAEALQDLPGAHAVLAKVALDRGDHSQSLAEARLAGTTAGEGLLGPLAVWLASGGRHAEVVALLQPLAEKASPPILALLGQAFFDLGKFPDAEAAATRALAVDPSSPRANELLGNVMLRTQRPADALRHLDSALAKAPRLASAWNSLGVARYQLGDPQGAMEAWQRAAALDGQLFDALFNLGLVAAEARDIGRARQALGRFVASAPPERFGADLARARQLLAQLGG
jgi:arylsulfatase A-like enzyme/Tfp pilus assembly protein PilF